MIRNPGPFSAEFEGQITYQDYVERIVIPREEKFLADLDKTLAERGSAYGDWQEQSWLAQKLKNDMRSMRGWEGLDHMLRNSLEMIAEKVSRAVCGDGSKIEDTLLDIEGYSRITRERLAKGAGNG